MTQFVSVHMICKENTNLGKRFLDSSLSALLESNYPNEIIFVDNGSRQDIKESIRDRWVAEFKNYGIPLKFIESEAKDFASLRNLCLEKTNPNANFFHWIDTDEVYYPEDLDILKNYILEPNIKQVNTYFWHLMIHPFQFMDRQIKDNVFRFTPQVRWMKDLKVHEHVHNLPAGFVANTNFEYVHFGYCRQQWRTCLKWFHYDYIAHGHINGYKSENVNGVIQPYFLHRTPDSILDDRNKVSIPFPSTKMNPKRGFPNACRYILGEANPEFYSEKVISEIPAKISGLAPLWKGFIEEEDSSPFWEEWKERGKSVGFSNTLDWVLEEMLKYDWRLV